MHNATAHTACFVIKWVCIIVIAAGDAALQWLSISNEKTTGAHVSI